ncbi:hypothetical protein GCM10022415_28980 [Knoellia locipacati]|uniref:Uncharacterized protein n=1 Tax=Knoellia locipacati TaxID=882824 RepID=A0A512T4J4_9MICO|nr:hypothetical protein [Knoellia locipacati]GEQ15137.1 hypothetical protein KLO01_31840 [Knoellia locipacati]
MLNSLPPLLTRCVCSLKKLAAALQATATQLWRTHLKATRTSPTYEIALLALFDLILGHRVDLHDIVIRLLTRLKRITPQPDDLEGWAY